MNSLPLDRSILREAAARALGEDVGPVDLTSAALVPADCQAGARIFVKEPGILAGLPIAEAVFMELDPSLAIRCPEDDGTRLEPGQIVMEIQGPAGAILSGERCALNFLQHLSGIATRTAEFVAKTEGTSTRILDTRKTTPGLRSLEKYAVACGGGINHRMGLYDAFMIKDNHVALMPGPSDFAEAVRKAREMDAEAPLIAEADTLDQVSDWLAAGVDRILLDNMSCREMKEAVHIVAGRCPLEASGNMTLERIPEVAACGVDYISVGELTHSVQALDFSLEIKEDAP
jgi:nicotinate-nucleotide pyrophosphorylase (carboxylating)